MNVDEHGLDPYAGLLPAPGPCPLSSVSQNLPVVSRFRRHALICVHL